MFFFQLVIWQFLAGSGGFDCKRWLEQLRMIPHGSEQPSEGLNKCTVGGWNGSDPLPDQSASRGAMMIQFRSKPSPIPLEPNQASSVSRPQAPSAGIPKPSPHCWPWRWCEFCRRSNLRWCVGVDDNMELYHMIRLYPGIWCAGTPLQLQHVKRLIGLNERGA